MIIDISTSSNSDETKYPEDNTNNAWQTVTTKRTKKKAPGTKRGNKVLKTSKTSKELVVSKPRLPKRSVPNASKLLTKRLNRNQNKSTLKITATVAKQPSEPPPVQQMERLQITEKGETGK